MVKTIISTIVAIILLAVGGILEHIYVQGSFAELRETLLCVYEKTEKEIAVKDDILGVQKQWISKKEKLHIYIPHADIRELDLWLSEAVTLIYEKKYADALSRLEVAIELTEQIPKNYVLRFENIF